MNSGNEKILADYLQRHEGDIAAGINDFADLRGIFIEVFNRKPDAPERPKHHFFGSPE